jgi:hypothetical protein
MIPMLVVKHALNIDILKMEHAFHSGYKEGDKVFYVSPTNWQGGVESLVGFEIKWNSQWKSKNDRFKEILHSNPNLKNFPIKYFLCGMETIAYGHGFHILIGLILMIPLGTSQWMQ